MNPALSKQAILIIETLCQQGCKEVNQILIDADKGKKISALDEFEAAQISLIIEELRQIMAVYKQD